MIVAQGPGLARRDDVAQRMAPEIAEDRLGAGWERGFCHMRRIPVEQKLNFDAERVEVIRGNAMRLLLDLQSVGQVELMKTRQKSHGLGIAFENDFPLDHSL